MQDNLPSAKHPKKVDQPSSGRDSRVLLNAVLMSLGTLVTRVFGLLRESLFAAYFSRSITDAWYVAFRLPNLFRRLFGEGSLSVSFIPVFVEAHIADSQTDAGFIRTKNLVNAFYTIFLIFLAVLSVLGVVFAESVVHLVVDPEYRNIAGKFELTVQMSQIMFSYVFLVCSYAYFMALLNALGSFALAAVAPVLMNIALIVGTLIPTSWLNWEGQAISWAVIIGGILQAAVLLPSLHRRGFFPRFRLDLRNPDVYRVLLAMLPGLLGLGLLQFTAIINTRFASSLGEGSVSYIYWADRLLELPLSLVSVSLGTALLPVLSRLWSENKRSEFQATVNSNLRLNILISGAAATGLYVLALPIVTMLFQRGRFTPEEAVITAEVVEIYAFLVIIGSCVRVLVPSFYSIKNTWLPAVISGVCLFVHIILAPMMMKSWGLFGLNLSSVATASLNLGLLLIGYHFVFGNFGYGKILSSLFKTALCCAALTLGLMSHGFVIEEMGRSLLSQIGAFLLSSLLGGSLFVMVGYLIKMDEMIVLLDRVGGKLKKKLNRAG